MKELLQQFLPIPPQSKQQEDLQLSRRDPLDPRRKSLTVEADLRRSAVKNAGFCTWKAVRKDEVHPNWQDRTALLELIQTCAKQKDLHKGSNTHALILDRGLLQKDIALSNALLSMYAKCGALAKAQEMFDQLPMRNAVTWNALIAAYIQHGLNVEALHLFEQMQDEGLSPNAVTFICSLKACSNLREIEKGEELHSMIRRQRLRLLEKNIALGTALVDMYAKCGALVKAKAVFDQLPERNVATWTSLIDGYAQHGLAHEALNCYDQMQDEGLSPNAITFLCVLKACSSTGEVEKGEEIHREIRRQGLIEEKVILGNALVDMYAKCGALAKSQEVFEELPSRSVAAWTALISGYVQYDLNDEGLRCFDRMQDEGLCPDAVTFLCVLQACANLGAVEKGEKVNAMVGMQGLLFKDSVLGTALMDMHAKCGRLEKAHRVFEELPARNVATWTAFISGYAQVGKIKVVPYLFDRMLREGIKPNSVTFVVLLNACSHAGLLKEGQMYFETMSKNFCIMPTFEHFSCIVDILSRAGHFDEAMSMTMYVQPSECLRLWSSLLGACQKWSNLELGRWTFERILGLNEKLDAPYVFMRNIYEAAGMQGAADKIR